MNEWLEGVKWLLGIGVEDWNSVQMSARAVVVYLGTLLLVRLGDKRFLGKNTAFDIILGIIIGSVASRAINGSAGLAPTLVASVMLIGLHWLFAATSYHNERFGKWIKGRPRLLVKKGEIDWPSMNKSFISQDDLDAAVRYQAGEANLKKVEQAYLERDGNISVIRRTAGPRILEVKVENGVQTVRIQLE